PTLPTAHKADSRAFVLLRPQRRWRGGEAHRWRLPGRGGRTAWTREFVRLRKCGLRGFRIRALRCKTAFVCSRKRAVAPRRAGQAWLFLPGFAARLPTANSLRTVQRGRVRRGRAHAWRRGPSCNGRASPTSERREIPKGFLPELPRL